mmetsp:Transcript_5642/g.20088  ORF Transcript_5642/g.20088 Transcript_5642/m.20088 type:complete len:229 (-) Transcript_5642:2104-2790(-)
MGLSSKAAPRILAAAALSWGSLKGPLPCDHSATLPVEPCGRIRTWSASALRSQCSTIMHWLPSTPRPLHAQSALSRSRYVASIFDSPIIRTMYCTTESVTLVSCSCSLRCSMCVTMARAVGSMGTYAMNMARWSARCIWMAVFECEARRSTQKARDATVCCSVSSSSTLFASLRGSVSAVFFRFWPGMVSADLRRFDGTAFLREKDPRRSAFDSSVAKEPRVAGSGEA